jgi:hypothetical protein
MSSSSAKRSGWSASARMFNAGYDPNTYSAGMLELIATFVPDRNGVSEAEATAGH